MFGRSTTENVHDPNLTVQPLDENLKMDTLSIENLSDGKANRKKTKRRKSKKAIVKDEEHSLDQNNIDARLTDNTAEQNVIMENFQNEDEGQSVGQTKMGIGPTEDNADGTVTRKRTKKRKRIVKPETEDEVQSKPDAKSLAEGNETTKRRKIKEEVQSIGLAKMGIGSTENPAEGNVHIEHPKTQDETQTTYKTNLDSGQTQSFIIGTVAGKRKTKKKRKKMTNEVDDIQKGRDARSMHNPGKGNMTIEKPNVKDKFQISGQIQMSASSTLNIAGGNAVVDYLKTQDEGQSMDQNKMDIWRLAENHAKGDVSGKSRKKWRKTKGKDNDDVLCEMVTRSTENLADGNATLYEPVIEDAGQSVAQIQMVTWSKEDLAGRKVIIKNPKTQDKGQNLEQNKMDMWQQTENLAPRNVTRKSRKKLKKKEEKSDHEFHSEIGTRLTENSADGSETLKKPETKDATLSVAQTQMDTGSTGNFVDGNVIIENLTEYEIQSIDQTKMDTGPTQNFAEGNVTIKRKKKKKKSKKAKVEGACSSIMDAGSTESLADVNVNIRIQDEVQSVSLKTTDARSENLAKGSVTFEDPKTKDEGQSTDKVKIDTRPAKDSTKEHVTGKRKRKRRSTRKSNTVGKSLSMNLVGTVTLHISEGLPNHLVQEKEMHVNGLSQLSSEVIMDERTDHADGRTAISTRNAFNMKDAAVLCLKAAPVASVRRKLIILDINGLLADIVYPAPKHCTADIKINGRAVFRRPFYDDFLKFCFQNFFVGIWSSRSKKIVDKVVSYLLGDQEEKLLFCWDMTHSTQTGFTTLENHHKPLVCKELRTIWEKGWPWKMGDYDESNTLLLDDSPYKALLNPLHTAIFPHSYRYSDENDNSLGPEGDLRVYLEGVLTSENVQKYVEQHPFGQDPITEQHRSWKFYSRVLNKMSTPVNHKTPSAVEA